MIWIEGTCCEGLRAAAGNLSVQLPVIAAEFPEVANCHRGTINLQLDFPLLVLVPDHRTKPIPWHPGFGAGEVFDLLRIELEAPAGAVSVPAWLYIPHGSLHRQHMQHHEVLAPKLPIRYGDRCRIGIARNAVQVPYVTYPTIIVI